MIDLKKIILLFLISSICGCYTRYDASIQLRHELFNKVRGLESKVKQQRTSLRFAFGHFETKINSQYPGFDNLAREWQGRCGKMKFELKLVRYEVDKLKEIAIKYFKNLQTVADSIKNEDIRKHEMAANRIHAKLWKALYAGAEESMKSLEESLRLNDDVHKVLVGAGLRYKRTNALKSLEEAKKRFYISLDRLAYFTQKAQRLLSVPEAKIAKK